MPVKSHDGLCGIELTKISIDPTIWDGALAFPAARCKAEGERKVVSTESKNAVRKAIAKLGCKALSEIGDITITPYVPRHQLIADLCHPIV